MTDNRATNPVWQLFEEAAARGVQVTVLTNPQSNFVPAYAWTFEEEWWGQRGRFKAGNISAWAMDRDGDYSQWNVRDGDAVVASGEKTRGDHFSDAVAAAEVELRKLGVQLA